MGVCSGMLGDVEMFGVYCVGWMVFVCCSILVLLNVFMLMNNEL